MSSPEAEKALSKAKIHLMGSPDSAFFASLCCQLEHIWDPGLPTAATNGRQIMYNPTAFLDLEPPRRVGRMMHEIMHVALEHCTILGPNMPKDLKPGKANRAMDYAINIIIDKAGFKLPKTVLLDYQYDGMSWRQIYDLLDDDPDDDKPDDVLPGTGDVDLQNHIDNMLVQAATQAQMAGQAGSIPGDIQRYLDKLTKPQLKWHQILASFFNQIAKVEYSFLRPNRRFFTQGILMPSCSGFMLEKGAVAVDVSGSITQKQFQAFVNEGHAIMRDQKPKALHFLQFDTRITRDDVVESLRDLDKVEFRKGGGTLIDPVMQWARDNKPNWLIVFTDGYFREPSINPKVPVVWIVHDNPNWRGPYGKTIHFKHEEE